MNSIINIVAKHLELQEQIEKHAMKMFVINSVSDLALFSRGCSYNSAKHDYEQLAKRIGVVKSQ